MAENFAARLTGPLRLRFLLQPGMAAFFAILDGRKDAREGNAPYGWSLFSHAGRRMDLLREGWVGIGKVFLVAVLIDAVYQVLELHFIYPGEALIVGFLLAIVPYVLLRGLVTRVSSKRGPSGAPEPHSSRNPRL
jgi:hypothetical protein